MSIERDRDDRNRRLVLRLKCLYTTAAASLLSLVVLIVVIQVGESSGPEIWQDALLFVGRHSRQAMKVTEQLIGENEK